MDSNFESKGKLVMIWKSAMRWGDKDPKGPTEAKHLQSTDIQNMISHLRVDSVLGATMFKEWDSDGVRLGLPWDFANRHPMGKWPF